ncbi:hypothetical protein WA1_12420 [Scytonema hofmannii PCC 7110]|uniref:Uncharacterized protein n=1 Tax=Scytonema hofmannii PCC 7110 TaxID=128403 RepID=A0A139XE03_9CYAN|nr:hypothetical protein WA1_12420 [Scytonema hofmannii PCC 7110]
MGISFLAIILNTNMFLDLKNFKNVNLVAIWSIVIYSLSQAPEVHLNFLNPYQKYKQISNRTSPD